jgi:uncharacterized membrane-anchored protein YitT (DUF2179 family)
MKKTLLDYVLALDYHTALRDWLYLTAGSFLLIVSVDVFLAPSNLSPGGVTGIAIIINEFTGWPIGMMMLLLNVPMLILGFVYLGRFRFLTSTLYVVLVYNLGVDYMVRWLPPGITDDLLLNALFGAVVGGIGGGLIYRGRGTAAGTGVLGRVMQLKTGIPLSQVYLITDGAVILAAGLLFGWEIALYSLLALFVWGLVTDYVLEGPSVVRTAFIVTDQAGEVATAVFEKLGIGVTGWTGRGMFTASERMVLFCTLNRPDVNELKVIVAETDPDAFIVIGHGHQARGGVLRQPRPITRRRLRLKRIGGKV